MRGSLTRFLMLLVLLPEVALAQTRISFDGIALGQTVKAVSAALREKGFKQIGKPQMEDMLFYGECRKVFFLGYFHGESACVALTESGKTGKVFRMDVQIRDFIDADEALEQLNVIIAEEVGRYPHFTRGKNTLTNLVEMMDPRGHLTKYLVRPEAECLLYFYEEDGEKTYIGNTSYQVCDMLRAGEHIIDIQYYDARSGEEAE